MTRLDAPALGWPSGRLAAALPFLVFGAACVVAGGMVAAVTAAAPSEQRSWVTAYLVLVAGVAQIGLGSGQALLARRLLTRRLLAAEFLGWNIGNLAVIVGTFAAASGLTDVGGVLLAGTLAIFASAAGGAERKRWLGAFRLLVLVLLVSIAIGLVLAQF